MKTPGLSENASRVISANLSLYIYQPPNSEQAQTISAKISHGDRIECVAVRCPYSDQLRLRNDE